ncbi:MAG: lipopolysaccharide transport system permease protein [Patiriisocius sp.]|jgi:lipopolysaccharide transport system permease protein
MKVTRYTSKLKYPLFQTLGEIFKSYTEGSQLASRIAVRDLRAQYRQSLLGFSWVLIVPIASTLLWVLLQKQGIISVEGLDIPYAVFALTGVVLWQLFVDSLNSPLNMFKQSKSMLTKINFPREALILAGAYKIIFNLIIKLLVLLAVFAYFKVIPGNQFYLIPIGMFSIMLLGLSIGILITPLGVLYNDVQQFLQTFIRLFFFLTPVIYLSSSDGILGLVNKFNPIGILLDCTRNWMTGQAIESLIPFYWILGGIVVLFLISSLIYKISMPIIIERIGA